MFPNAKCPQLGHFVIIIIIITAGIIACITAVTCPMDETNLTITSIISKINPMTSQIVYLSIHHTRFFTVGIYPIEKLAVLKTIILPQ